MAKQGPEFDFASRLLDWYDAHRRSLPWRAAPGEAVDPYRVWLSEIMLQQTTVQAVKAYFEKFTALWPRVEDLAAAPLDDVLKAWAGLGYYARARNLHACARKVVAEHGGRFPDTPEGLRSLPGIGPYTAGAIAAIAFGKPCAAVDGNVERVASRVFLIDTPLPAAKPEIGARVQSLVPSRRAGDFAQALMDLGATICTPRSPNCLICPWAEHCAGRLSGLAPTLPKKQEKKPVPARIGAAFWAERQDGAVLLRRRPDKGLLGGMMEVPTTAWSVEPLRAEGQAPFDAAWRKLSGSVTHTFTHFRLELEIWTADGIATEKAAPGADYRWVAPDDVDAEALPTVMRKVVAHARRHREG